MDIQNIIDLALEKSCHDIANREKLNIDPNYKEDMEKADKYRMLMGFSANLLEIYHQELTKQLRKNGINL